MDRNIAEIQEHDLRSVWQNEERDFTRWLREHIELLAVISDWDSKWCFALPEL